MIWQKKRWLSVQGENARGLTHLYVCIFLNAGLRQRRGVLFPYFYPRAEFSPELSFRIIIEQHLSRTFNFVCAVAN